MTYLNEIAKLRETSTAAGKQNILRNASPLFKEILYQAYNPYRHYYVKSLPKMQYANIMSTFESATWVNLLNELTSRELSGDEAIQSITNFLSCGSADDAKVFLGILNKDLRCHINVKTINKAIPGLVPEFGVMLAKEWTDNRYTNGMYMSLKYDGLRAIFKDGKLHTRTGRPIKGVDHLNNMIPASLSLDGEIMVPGAEFNKQSGLIRSHSLTPEAVYYVFDSSDYDDFFDKRYAFYTEQCKNLNPGFIKPVKHIKVNSIQHISNTYDKAIDAGYEGLVVKTGDHLYQNKRSGDWLKIKAVNSEDLPIVGFFQGEGKYEGSLGGVIVERRNGVHVKVGSGFSDDQRNYIWNTQASFLNQIAEIKYHEETPSGSFRHPVFKGIRDDK